MKYDPDENADFLKKRILKARQNIPLIKIYIVMLSCSSSIFFSFFLFP